MPYSPLPDPLGSRPFHVSEARALDVGEGRLRGRDLDRPFRAVRSSASVDPVLAYVPRLAPGQFFSHQSAARLLNLRGQRFAPAPVHVSVHGVARPPRARGLVGHRSLDSRVVIARGLPTAHPVDTWAALATALPLDRLIEMGDGLVRRQSPLATLDDLADTVARYAGRRGAATLTAALAEIRPRTDSDRETQFRLLLTRSGLPEPVVNPRIVNEFGAFVAHVDLLFEEYRVIAEYDGRQHAEDTVQYERDIARIDDLVALGYRHVRIGRHQLELRAPALSRVTAALIERGWCA